VWTNTDKYSTMRDKQFECFKNYNGLMEQAPKKPCDLFLLSWTLTTQKPPAVPTPIRTLADEANRNLGDEVVYGQTGADPIPNREGKIMNLLYVDYVQYARVTDIALIHNLERARVARRRELASAKLSIKAKRSAKAATKKKKAGNQLRT
jgi:hypothetical protein